MWFVNGIAIIFGVSSYILCKIAGAEFAYSSNGTMSKETIRNNRMHVLVGTMMGYLYGFRFNDESEHFIIFYGISAGVLFGVGSYIFFRILGAPFSRTRNDDFNPEGTCVMICTQIGCLAGTCYGLHSLHT